MLREDWFNSFALKVFEGMVLIQFLLIARKLHFLRVDLRRSQLVVGRVNARFDYHEELKTISLNFSFLL